MLPATPAAPAARVLPRWAVALNRFNDALALLIELSLLLYCLALFVEELDRRGVPTDRADFVAGSGVLFLALATIVGVLQLAARWRRQ